MTKWDRVPLALEEWCDGKQPVFRASPRSFTRDEVRQKKLAAGSDRQKFFEQQLSRIADTLGQSVVPISIEFERGVRRRLDLGCIGHSVARGFIRGLVVDDDGNVTHLEISQ